MKLRAVAEQSHPPAADGGCFACDTGGNMCEVMEGNPSSEPTVSLRRFPSGAVRSTDADEYRYDLISPIGLRRLAMTCAEGAQKYGEYNWLKGMPVSDILNHAIKHIFEFLRGDESEDHLAHAAWNLFASMHFQETRPDLLNMRLYEVDDTCG
jgi:hypothetical protein